MRTNHLAYSILVVVVLSVFSGCKKDKQTAEEDFTTTAIDIGQSENVSTEVDNMVSQARMGSFSHDNNSNPSFDQFNFHSCATVTNDSVNHVLTFDFGTGCIGNDGKTRAGRMIVNYTGTGYFTAGSSWVMTFDSFYVNSRHIEGTRSVVNNGLNGSGNMTWSINAQNMKITRTDGSWRSWNSQRTREMVAGYGDSTWTNDVYLINGTMTGTNSSGETTSSILTNVRRDHSCNYITSGTIEITPSSRPLRIIDFGNGTCDDLAIVTKNGISHSILLRF